MVLLEKFDDRDTVTEFWWLWPSKIKNIPISWDIDKWWWSIWKIAIFSDMGSRIVSILWHTPTWVHTQKIIDDFTIWSLHSPHFTSICTRVSELVSYWESEKRSNESRDLKNTSSDMRLHFLFSYWSLFSNINSHLIYSYVLGDYDNSISLYCSRERKPILFQVYWI